MISERLLTRADGPDLAIKRWHGAGVPVIALHGWLDNAASFDRLGPLLRGIDLIAVDLPGHGRSQHRGPEGDYCIWSYLEDVLWLAAALELQTFSLLGHSMGGAVASLLASVVPARIQRLVLLDSTGPLSTPASEAPAQMAKALRQSLTGGGEPRHFDSFELAVAARANKGLEMDAATLLAERGVSEAEGGTWFWHADRRLRCANPLSLTEEQVQAFHSNIACPSLMILASIAGWERPPGWEAHQARRLSYIAGLETVTLPGHHHQHLEGQVQAVAAHLNRFL